MDPRGTVGRIYKKDHYTLLHTKYGPGGIGEEDFLRFSHDAPRVKALGLVVSEKKIFLCFTHCMSMGANDPWGGASVGQNPPRTESPPTLFC